MKSLDLQNLVFALIFIAFTCVKQICCKNLGFVGEQITQCHKIEKDTSFEGS